MIVSHTESTSGSQFVFQHPASEDLPMQPGCEIHFLDVGQGCSSIIFYKNGDRPEAVIIDCGRGALLKEVIERLNVEHIAALIVTHCDIDHLGGLGPIVQDENWGGKRGKIDAVYLVPDKHTRRTTGRPSTADGIIECLQGRDEAGSLRAGFLNRGGPIVSVDIGGHRLEVRALAPSFGANHKATKANDTSGIVELTFASHRVLFCGDSSWAAWQRILKERGGETIKCEAAVVPHHGGRMRAGRRGSYAEDFFNRVVKAKYAILSFSASNHYGHPNVEVVQAARKSSATLLCTQVQPPGNQPPYHGDGVVPPTRFSRSGMRPGKPELSKGKKHPDRRKHFACAGSITLSLEPDRARWGAAEDADPICGFKTIDELRYMINKAKPCSNCECAASTPPAGGAPASTPGVRRCSASRPPSSP
jgi:beta-lactamase superfamily II metal-dependent hydrolase